MLVVTDTGQGLSGEQIPRLFEPFERLGHPGLVRDGSGLGLLIARGLVEHMGGSLIVESKLGLGTRVVIELPLAEPHSLFGDLDDVIDPEVLPRVASLPDDDEQAGSAIHRAAMRGRRFRAHRPLSRARQWRCRAARRGRRAGREPRN